MGQLVILITSLCISDCPNTADGHGKDLLYLSSEGYKEEETERLKKFSNKEYQKEK